MSTTTYKPGRKPSGATRKVASVCKTSTGRHPAHTPAPQPHPSIPSIIRSVCTGCGTVISWKA